jgi:alanine dehydrogenase
MPGAVPVSSSHALNNATLPFGLALASSGLKAIFESPHLRVGLNVHGGEVTNAAVAHSLGLQYRAPEEVLES